MYDLVRAAKERRNLFDESQQAVTRARLTTEWCSFFQKHADPRYGLWWKGCGKAGRILKTDRIRNEKA